VQRFKDKSVIVTGAAQGMGLAQARGFLGEGARVVLVDINGEAGTAQTRALGDNALFIQMDVSRADDWSRCVRETEDAFGPISVLVNNAALITRGKLEENTPELLARTLEVNLLGPMLAIRAVAPSMRKAGAGAIVNVSSVAGLMGVATYPAYSATKWGLRGLTRTAALDLGRDNIRVNSVHPGVIGNGEPLQSEIIHRIVQKYPIQRPGLLEEVTRMVLFVASDEASFSTGQEFVCDGGQSAGEYVFPN
jgi:3alpha(or 20beta)-hydroxysteroid dehydrogenase